MRISDLGMQQILLQGFQNNQAASQVRELQLASGDRFQTYGEYGADALRLVSSEGVVARASAFENAAGVALNRLEAQGASLETVTNAVQSIREGLIRTLSTGAAELLAPDLDIAAQRAIAALNVDLGGVFIFGGADGDTPPVAAQNLDDIGAAASIDGLFNEGGRLRLAVEEGVSIDGGPVASDVAGDLFAELQDFAAAQGSLGPFQGDLTDAQRAFIIEKNERLGAIVDDLLELQGISGVAQTQAADAVARNTRARDLAELVAVEIEDADIAEALAGLNQDRLAIEASARALAQASELSLLNFI